MELPYRYLQEVLDEGVCPECDKKSKTIGFQFSYGIYAGVMCENCARSKYRDQCGHGRPMGTRSEYESYGEAYDDY